MLSISRYQIGEAVKVAVGVDAHKSSFAIVAISAVGDELDSFSVPATPEGGAPHLKRREPLLHTLPGAARPLQHDRLLAAQSFRR